MLTQKYKQQQQQVRVQTSESNYAKGMFFSDVPLTEGYSKVLVNWDIDPTTGKLTPRKGLKTVKNWHDIKSGFTVGLQNEYNNLDAYCVTVPNSYNTNKHLLSVFHNTSTGEKILVDSDLQNPGLFTSRRLGDTTVFRNRISINKHTHDVSEYSPGTFAFNAQYFHFINTPTAIDGRDAYPTHLGRLPYKNFPGMNSTNVHLLRPTGTPGTFITTSNTADMESSNNFPQQGDDIIWYYNSEGKAVYCKLLRFESAPSGKIYVDIGDNPDNVKRKLIDKGLYPDGTVNALINFFKDKCSFINGAYYDKDSSGVPILVPAHGVLNYTKLGKHATEPTDDAGNTVNSRAENLYYSFNVEPQKLNPTEAVSWGYNMLLEDPYDFACETTAANVITILGILPYDNTGKIILTPRKNQEVTLKAYYRAPEEYYTDANKPRYYATTKINELTKAEIDAITDPKQYSFGSWWYATDTKKYYMLMPGATLKDEDKRIAVFGDSKPAASVQLRTTTSATTPTKIRVRWQMRAPDSSDWIDISNETMFLSEAPKPLTVSATLPHNEVLIKLTITDPEDVVDGEEYILATEPTGLSLVSDDLANTLNLNPVSYNLGTCTGMLEWENRLVVWGVENAESILFVSDVNNPTFFPYPNNIDTFNEPIRAVYSFGKELLVLTASALYRLAWDTEGAGWTHKLVQRNLRITEAEAKRCCVVKNMFMFTSNGYYYMMVPKATSEALGETTIAPISKPINDLLDNWDTEIKQLCLTIADKSDFDMWVKMPDAFNNVFTNNNKIIINEVYQIGTVNVPDTEKSLPLYLYIQLIYDTETRAWSLRIFNSTSILYGVIDNTVTDEYYLSLLHQDESIKITLSLANFSGKEVINDKLAGYVVAKPLTLHYLEKPIINNYQYLDTGNRDINTDMKKRFREFQFKIRNGNATSLGMRTSFLIDGALRRDLQKFSPRYITDEATGEAVIVIERTLDNNPDYLSFVPEYKITRVDRVIVPEKMLQDSGELTPTALAESTDPDYWVIDQSAFPGRTFWKIRVAISGKGYTPRAQLLSTNLKYFEVLGHSWVYRTMHGR